MIPDNGIYKYSLIFLEGSKESFDEALELIRKDSLCSSVFYFRNTGFLRGEYTRGELFSFSTDRGICYPPEYFSKVILYEDNFFEIKEKLKDNTFVFIRGKEGLLKAGFDFPLYSDYEESVLIPCFSKNVWSGFLFCTLDKENKPNIELLKNVSSIICKSSGYVNSLLQETMGKSKYRAILENIEDGYFEIDIAGNLRAFNDSVCRISGLSRKDLMGINNRAYTSPETAENMYRVFSEIFKTDIPLKIKDYEVILNTGEKKWIELSASLIKDERGDSIGFRGLVRDVTARKKGEYERKRLEEKLNQAQRLEAIGTLAGGIAHDFNNLLMAVQGNASLIMAAAKDNKIVLEKAASIEKCVERGADLTKQLLGFARGGKYIARPCNINRIIDASLVMFSRAHKELTIDTDFDGDIFSVEADPSQLEQVFINIFLNAWYAMDGRGLISIKTVNRYLGITVTAPHEIPQGDFVEVEIRDSGGGMDDETRKRIFEPFFTTREKGRGTGLGLASVFGIVKNHGGFITVSSKLRIGTSFKLYFPVFKIKEECFQKGDCEIYAKNRTKSVLLVDDECSILEVGAAMLSEMGYNVSTAASGHEAVAIYRKRKEELDIVILDMIMPDLDGVSTYNELKKINENVIVLFSSGYVGEEQYGGDVFEKKSGNSFISKPYNLSSLSRKLDGLLNQV